MIFRELPIFFKVYSGIFLGMITSLLFLEHGELLLWINRHRTHTLDLLMPYLTFLGDGILFAMVALILIFFRRKVGIIVGISGLVMSGITAILKRVIFVDVPRPKRYFAGTDILDFVEGVRVAGKYSFPSGHSTSAFMIAGILAIIYSRNSIIQYVGLLLALLAAFSRVYLLQHFYIDVVAGSVLGVVLALITGKWLWPLTQNDLEN